jgi:hypothetical protein
VFTHLPLNSIERCLLNMAEVLKPGGRFYATYFEVGSPHHVEAVEHPGGTVTSSDATPFHYHFSVLEYLVRDLPLTVNNIGD